MRLVHAIVNIPQLMFESVETQLWVAKAVWQRIPSRRSTTGLQRQNADDRNRSAV